MNAIYFYRLERWLYTHKLKPFAKIVQALIFIMYNSKITGSCLIGKGTYFVSKCIGVNLVDDTIIGNNCRIGIGAKFVKKAPFKHAPNLGNNIWVGPGAVIVGPVKIEDNVIIAANSVVTKSVPEGKIVGGIPAKIIGNVADLNYNVLENPKYDESWADYLN